MSQARSAGSGKRQKSAGASELEALDDAVPGWRRRVVDRSLGKATRRSLDRGADLIYAATKLLEESDGEDFTVQDVADAAKQSLRSLYVHFDGKDDLLLGVFEEAIRTYTRQIEEAIEIYEEPLERLTAAIYFGVRIAEIGPHGVSIGLARVQSKLIEVASQKLSNAQAPVTEMFARLLQDASDAGDIRVANRDTATYMLLTLRKSVSLSHVLGDGYGLELPNVVDLVEFCLRGLGAELPDGWFARFEKRWETLPHRASVGEIYRRPNRKTE